MERTYTPNALALILSKTLGRTVSPKQVRGRVRGDSGKALLERLSNGVKAPHASHVYSAREADVIGTAFVASHNARTGQTRKWTRLGPVSAPRKASKPASKSPASKPATVAPSAPSAE